MLILDLDFSFLTLIANVNKSASSYCFQPIITKLVRHVAFTWLYSFFSRQMVSHLYLNLDWGIKAPDYQRRDRQIEICRVTGTLGYEYPLLIFNKGPLRLRDISSYIYFFLFCILFDRNLNSMKYMIDRFIWYHVIIYINMHIVHSTLQKWLSFQRHVVWKT